MSLRSLGMLAGIGVIAAFPTQAQQTTGDIVDQILNPTTMSSPDPSPPMAPVPVPQRPAPPPPLKVTPVPPATALAAPPAQTAVTTQPPATPPPAASTPQPMAVAAPPAPAASAAKSGDILGYAAPVPAAAPAPAPIFAGTLASGWSGPYAGINIGTTWGSPSSSVTTTTTFVNTAALSALGQTYGPAAAASANGRLSTSEAFIGGGELGYDLPVAPGWMAGFVGDLDTTSTSGASFSDTVARAGFPTDTVQTTVQVSNRLSYLATLRGRIGYLVDPQLWIYATGGFAFGGAESSTQLTAIEIPNTGSTNIHASGHGSSTQPGYTIGGGAEWRLDQTWSVKAEYLYYQLSSLTYNNNPFSAFLLSNGAVDNRANSVTTARFDGSMFRIGVDYHF